MGHEESSTFGVIGSPGFACGHVIRWRRRSFARNRGRHGGRGGLASNLVALAPERSHFARRAVFPPPANPERRAPDRKGPLWSEWAKAPRSPGASELVAVGPF